MSAENDRLAEESVAAPVVPAQGVAYATMPPRKPMSKKVKLSITAALVVVLVLVVGVVAINMINSGRNAEEVVRNYAQLIADGKYDEANKVVDPGVGKSKRMLLTNKAYTGAKKAVKVVSVTQREADEDTPNKAIVDVVMSINGESTTYSLGVKQGIRNMDC